MDGSSSHLEFFFGKSSQNTSKPVQIFWSSSIPYVFCLYIGSTFITAVIYYDVSVLSMSVMGFQKNIWIGVGGVSSIQVFFGFWKKM